MKKFILAIFLSVFAIATVAGWDVTRSPGEGPGTGTLINGLPFTEGFEVGNVHDSGQISGWTQVSDNGSETWKINIGETDDNISPRTGLVNAILPANNEDWLIRPIELVGGQYYVINLYARQYGSTETDASIGIYFGTAESPMTSIFGQINLLAGDYQLVDVNFCPAEDGIYNLGIKGVINSSASYISLDDITITLYPDIIIPAGGDPTELYFFEGKNVELQFTEPNVLGFTVNAFMIETLPTNNSGLPETMDSFLPCYWQIESSLPDPGPYIITFNLAELGVENFDLVRFFKRADSTAPWVDVVLLGGVLSWSDTKVTITGLSTFSEFIPGIESTLPVTLSSFNAFQTDNNLAQINWTTASESGVLGYNLYRSETDNQDETIRVTATIIEATNSVTGSNYSYIDDEVEFDITYYYWLQSNDFDGTTEMFGPVTVKISTDEDNDIEGMILGTQMFANYPNPFNPSTTISFSVAEPQVVTIDIYNVRGQLVKKVFNEQVEKINVKHNVVWNGQDSNGCSVASGIYFTIMKADYVRFINKIVLMK